METIRLILSSVLIAAGMFFFVSAAFGVNRFRHALNRIHAAALGDTLGMFFLALGLVIHRGFCFTSAKLLAVVFFFWLASPVASHMIGQLEMETDEDLGELKRRNLTEHTNEGDPNEGNPNEGNPNESNPNEIDPNEVYLKEDGETKFSEKTVFDRKEENE